MKRAILLSMLLIILFSFLVVAQEEHDFTEAKQLIDSGVSCNQLTNEQLEEIGDYYMEQMHPGEAHEYMDKMMGGEGSESLKQVHISMAKSIYCGETNQGMMGMMNMMNSDGNMMGSGGMMGGDMRGLGIMGNNDYQNPQNNNSYQNNFVGFQLFFYVLSILIITVLFLVIILLINKAKQKRRNNKRGKQQ